MLKFKIWYRLKKKKKSFKKLVKQILYSFYKDLIKHFSSAMIFVIIKWLRSLNSYLRHKFNTASTGGYSTAVQTQVHPNSWFLHYHYQVNHYCCRSFVYGTVIMYREFIITWILYQIFMFSDKVNTQRAIQNLFPIPSYWMNALTNKGVTC